MGGRVFLQIIFLQSGDGLSKFCRSCAQKGFQVARGEYFR